MSGINGDVEVIGATMPIEPTASPWYSASPYDQDDVAWSLYQWRGSGPWGGMCDPE